MTYRTCVLILAGFSFGVFINSFLDFGLSSVLLFVFLGAVLWWLDFLKYSKSKIFLSMGLLIFAMGLGQLRFQQAENKAFGEANLLKKNLDQKMALRGVVSDEPEEKENYARIVFEEETSAAKILVYLQSYPKYKYGDKLNLKGVLKRPQNFNASASKSLQDLSYSNKSVNNNNFNWPDYLAKEGIYFEMFYPQAEYVSSGNGLWIKEKLFDLKKEFLSAISKNVPEPHGAFLGGITIGARESLPGEWQEMFKTTGVAHIVALSGYNIAIVAESVMLLFSFLPRYLAVGGGALGIILFAIMTGSSATVLRASIMALFALTAKATGRIYTVSWALFLAGFFMVLQNPKILRFDTSFQLSFLATLGLIHLSPLVKEKMSFITDRFKLREIFSATVAAQVFVLPLLMFKTGELSLAGLPVNFLILPFIPLTMFMGFGVGILGMISSVLAAPFAWLSYALLQYELWIVEIFSKLPFASVHIPGFSEILLVLSYAAMFLGLHAYKKRKEKLELENAMEF
ncbi:ComEC family competence protein [Candidatus Parcubacteria bacterium]|nr:MAG: ComEC family competence protein [Candidatus Parcubacteria bacterium]